MAQPTAPRTPLGVGSLVTATFGLFFCRILMFMVVGSLPAAVVLAFMYLFGQNWLEVFESGLLDAGTLAPLQRGFFVLFSVLMIVSLISICLIVLCAYDAYYGAPARMLSHLWRSLLSIPAIVVLSALLLIVFLAFSGVLFALQAQLHPILAALVWFLAMLYVLARYSVLLPVILIGRAGFRALGQTAWLTAGYRWSIVGLYLLFALAVFLFSLIPGLIIILAQASALGGSATFATVALGVAVWALSVVQTGLFGVLNTLLYIRLREVKEGVSTADLFEVFA